MVKSIIERDSDLESVASSTSTTLPKSRLLAKSTPDLTESGKPTPTPRPMHLRSTTVSSGSARKPAPLHSSRYVLILCNYLQSP